MTRILYRGYKPVGGVISKVSGLVTLRTVRAFVAICLALLTASCQKEGAESYAELSDYYLESTRLQAPAITGDSIKRFSQKVDAFVTLHPQAQADPLYPQIQQNIRQANLRIIITINGEWDGETHLEY